MAVWLVPGVLILLFLLWQGLMYVIALFQRPANERIVVTQISSVLRQNLPLATALSLAADSERGMARIHLKRISRLLSQGACLSEALHLGYRECSGLVVSLVAAGEKAGRVLAALEQAEDYLVRKARWRSLFDLPIWFYCLVVILNAVFLLSGIMVAVVPKFQQIFVDFGTKLPGMTIWLIEASRWFVAGTPPGWVVVVMIPLIWLGLRVLRVDGRPMIRVVGEYVRSLIPGIRRMEFGRSLSEMLRLMRTAVGSGMDLASAARLSTELMVNGQVRRRMRGFADMLDRGVKAPDACRTAGLGAVLATALSAGLRSGNMDGALRYAADYYEAIVARWWIILTSLVWPVCTLCLAVLVGFCVVALFLPLVELINSCMGWIS